VRGWRYGGVVGGRGVVDEMKSASVKIDTLHADPANLRLHPSRNLDTIKASLARFGQQKPIVVDAKGVVRAGNGTLEAAKALGWKEISVVRTNLEGSEAIAYAIADNRTAELAEWDDDRLGETLKALELEEFDLDALGFSKDELDELLGAQEDVGSDAEDPGAQIDKAGELQAKWKTARGQLWEIGKHRLLCGDSTEAEDVARVMGGEKAELCFTSPPYGQQRDYESGIGDWDKLMRGVFGALPMADAGQVLVNLGLIHSDGEWLPYWDGWIQWMREQGWRRFGWYVWDKQNGLPGDWNGRLAPSHEFVFHFNRSSVRPEKIVATLESSQNRTGNKLGLRSKDGSVKPISSPDKVGQSTKIPDSVIRITPHLVNDVARECHPATYPVAFPVFGMQCWPGLVYEPFAGSGTTLVAAEQTGRICRGIEIEPKYVAVILERMAGMGLNPQLVMDSAKEKSGQPQSRIAS
jgi:DNA modification methylase